MKMRNGNVCFGEQSYLEVPVENRDQLDFSLGFIY